MTAACEAGAELIAFPEVVLDRFFPQNPGDKEALDLAEPIPGPTTERIAARARELGLVTVFNLYELDAAGAGGSTARPCSTRTARSSASPA